MNRQTYLVATAVRATDETFIELARQFNNDQLGPLEISVVPFYIPELLSLCESPTPAHRRFDCLIFRSDVVADWLSREITVDPTGVVTLVKAISTLHPDYPKIIVIADNRDQEMEFILAGARWVTTASEAAWQLACGLIKKEYEVKKDADAKEILRRSLTTADYANISEQYWWKFIALAVEEKKYVVRCHADTLFHLLLELERLHLDPYSDVLITSTEQ